MLKEKKYFLFDIDGTIAIDDILYEGSRELLAYIDSIGGRSFYITNNSTKSRKDYVYKFKKWGIDTVEAQFMTASYAACRYLKKYYSGRKLFVLGTPSFEEELRDYGLIVTKKAEKDVSCVVAGFDRTLSYEKIEAACFVRGWTMWRRILTCAALFPMALCRTAVESVECLRVQRTGNPVMWGSQMQRL